MKLKTRTRTLHTLTTEDGREFELTHEPANTEHILVGVGKDEPVTVIGYCAHDDDCRNPLEDCDGNGRILDRRPRESSAADIAAFYDALGIDTDTDESYVTGAYREAAYEHGEGATCDLSPSEVRAYCKAHDIAVDLDGVTVANPYAVLLDVYEHSGTLWSVAGARGWPFDCPWDTSRQAGAWVPDDACREHIESFPEEERRAKAIECAESAVSEYNKWLAGDCWGVIVESFDADGESIEDDSYWGFIGWEYALEELASTFKHYTAITEGVPV